MLSFFFFFFNDTATTEIYTLSLHDALPISTCCCSSPAVTLASGRTTRSCPGSSSRSEEHTSELQSHLNLVCRLLFETKHTEHEVMQTYVRRALAIQCHHRYVAI